MIWLAGHMANLPSWEKPTVTALLDRLVHHAHILKWGPRSRRTKVQTTVRVQEPMK